MAFEFSKDRMTRRNEHGDLMGYITFPQVKKNLVNIDHVFTDPAFRGQGNAAVMMEVLLCHLEEQGKKALLTCPYAQSYVAEHPQWTKLLPNDIKFEKN